MDEMKGAGARFVRLFQRLAEGERDFALKDLAARLDLAPSTTHRLLQPLVAADLVERTGEGGYRLGPEFYRLSSLVLQKFDILKIARPALNQLWLEYRETCCLALHAPATRTAVVVETLRSTHPLQFVIEPNTHLSLIWGSLGRSILAWLDPDEIDAVLAEARPGLISGRAPPPRAELMDELDEIRRRGCALYEDLAYPDFAGVAAPVFRHDGRVLGCIGVVLPASRFQPLDKAALSAQVVWHARRLSAAIGFAAEDGDQGRLSGERGKTQ